MNSGDEENGEGECLDNTKGGPLLVQRMDMKDMDRPTFTIVGMRSLGFNGTCKFTIASMINNEVKRWIKSVTKTAGRQKEV